MAPYNAEEAPGSNSTPCMSNSEIPNKFPTGKFKAGDALSIPSTSCKKRVFENAAKPLVLTDLNVKLLVFTSTPLRFSKPS